MTFYQGNSFSSIGRYLPEKVATEELKNKIRYRYCPEIRYHLPYERLNRRKIFMDIIKKYISDQIILKLDNFALFDAVSKRGGYHQVVAKNRWDQIGICLQYQKKIWSHHKYYCDHLLKFENEIITQCNWYSSTQIYQNQVIELHLLTPNTLTPNYYQYMQSQYMLADTYFFSLDQYFNIKTLAMGNSDLSRISIDYAQKYMIAKKWMLFSGQIKSNIKQLKYLGTPSNHQSAKIVIVGLSMPTLLIADRLSDFGLNVVIIDKGRRQERLKDQFQIVENGLILFEGGNTIGSYYNNLQNNLISINEVCIPNGGMLVLDEQGKPFTQQRIRLSQQHFFGIIEELKGQLMSKKNLYEQVVTRMIRKKLQYDRFLIRWHYDRYMTFNRIKGDSTTVGDLAAYQSKRYIKHIAQNYQLGVITSVEKLLSKVKEKKNITFIQTSIQYISHQSDHWNIHIKFDIIKATHFIYADQETIFKGVLDGNPKMPEIASELTSDTLPMLQQLTVMKYINCLFRFRQKIILKQHLRNQSCFSICCAHGFIYFFILNGGAEIMAILKCYHTSTINYYSEILNILQNRCLIKNNRFINEQIYSFEYTFGVKDQKYLQSIIKIKSNQKMYLFLPITTTNTPHRITAQIQLSNYICKNILQEIYQDYQKYDHSIRQNFMQKNQLFNLSPAFIKSASKNQEGSLKKQASFSSLPILASSISINTQQNSKIKIVLAVPNFSITDSKSKIIEGQLPSIQAIHMMQDDWFGLKHPIVQGYELFLKHRIQNSLKIKEGLQNFNIFSLQKPIKLYPDTILYSFGNPFINESQWYTSILTNIINTSNYIFCLNGLVVRRQFISIYDTFKTTIYYQTIVNINEQIYYCIIDEYNLNIKYFHTNLTILISFLIKKLQLLRNEQVENSSRSYNHLKISRCKFTDYPPKQLLPFKIAAQIKQEISKLNQTLDQLLQSKFQNSLKYKKYQKYMGNQREISQDRQILSSNILTPQQIIYRQINQYIKMLGKIYDLKYHSIFDIFFGVLNEQYIACEIMKKFSRQPLTYFDLQKLDEPLSKQVQQIFSKNIVNQLYSIIIVPQQGDIYFHRNFLSSHGQQSFERYTYIRSLVIQDGNTRVRHYLSSHLDNKREFINSQEIMLQIIKQLILRHQQQTIIRQFQFLINKDIQNQINLTSRIKMYYRMTRKCFVQQIQQNSIQKFNNKYKQLNQKQKNKINILMKQKKIRWIDNQLIFIIQ